MACSPLKTMLLALAPELSKENGARLDQFLGFAALRVNRRVFGDRADLATCYLAAHMLTKAPGSGGAANAPGSVTTERIGDMSTGYSNLNIPGLVPKADVEFMTTTFGAEYVTIRNGVLTSPLIAGC